MYVVKKILRSVVWFFLVYEEIHPTDPLAEFCNGNVPELKLYRNETSVSAVAL